MRGGRIKPLNQNSQVDTALLAINVY